MDLRELYERDVYENLSPEKEAPQWVIFAVDNLSKFELNGKHVLDVGAGFGYVLNKLKDKEIIPYAVELSDKCIKHLKEQGIDAKKVDISTEDLPFSDNFFDYVIFTEVVEHLVFPQHILNEIYRVLKPNGRLVISTHNIFNAYMRIRYFLGKIPTPDLDVTRSAQHIRLYNYALLSGLLRSTGFEKTTNKSWFKVKRISFQVPECLTPLLANHFLFICTK
ncbi:class I SAM-dependent methyltransferase [Candidatus Bathyarchaeota archaeon]|nr:class I SAM-dependent methyltransferase [Candidatus Bathyarchaeota archaeon]